MKKYLFFDTTWNQILRVGNLVAIDLKKEMAAETYGLVYETSGKKVNPDNDVTAFDDYMVTTDIESVRNFIFKIHPDVVVFAQNTIPDLSAILYSQDIGAKIAMMQHGLLYDGATLNNVRIGEIFAALMMAKKTFNYFNILRIMCKHRGKSFVRAISKIISEKNNVTTTIQNFFIPPLRGDTAYVIGQHWVDYYHENYGYDKSKIYIMGNHDVDDLEEGRELENAICYIPSVHVEDGHVQERVFVDFLEQLAKSIPQGMKLYVKLHPRSNKDLYLRPLQKLDVVYIQGKELPYVKLYIGHNSSLLSKALQISGRLILWGFKEEKDLFYKDFAYAVCHDGDALKAAVIKAVSDSNIKGPLDISQFSYKNPVGAYRYCAQLLSRL